MEEDDEPDFVNRDDNVYHVVIATGGTPQALNSALLDGFTIKGGNCYGLSTSGAGLLYDAVRPNISRCIFEDNLATTGAAIGCMRTTNLSPRVFNSTFRYNKAMYGSAIFLDASGNNGSLDIMSCLFHDNWLFEEGEGTIYASLNTSPKIHNCTIANNDKGVYHEDADGGSSLFGTLNIHNTIIWSNGNDSLGHQVTGQRNATYSDTQGGTLSGTGNVSVDPQFVNAGTDDYRLGGASPVMDAGSVGNILDDLPDLNYNSNISENSPYAIDGNSPREQCKVDMGAYERAEDADFCDADIDDSGNVGIQDLLGVLGSWGVCGDPGNCPADFLPAPCGDDFVGIGELLWVISSWNTICVDGQVAEGPESLPNDVGDCMDLAAEAGPIGSSAYERAFEGCIELLCAREIIDCD